MIHHNNFEIISAMTEKKKDKAVCLLGIRLSEKTALINILESGKIYNGNIIFTEKAILNFTRQINKLLTSEITLKKVNEFVDREIETITVEKESN